MALSTSNSGVSRQRRHQMRHPERRLAREAVREAVKRGVLPPASTLACVECGAPAAEYDHHLGYEPEHALDVQALCKPCHAKRPKSVYVDRTTPPVAKVGKVIRNRYSESPVRKLLGLREVRERRALSRDDLARKSGVGVATIVRLELGYHASRPATTQKLARALGVEPSVLMDAPRESDE
jgi:DNA-binding XRE family transcriptional regulator